MSRLLYVANLNPDIGREDLASLFGCHGTVRSAAVTSRPETPGAVGTGLVEMDSDAQAQAVIAALNGACYHGSALTIAWATPAQGRGLSLRGMLQPMPVPDDRERRRIRGPWGTGIATPPWSPL